jgi:hypothetical protein
MSSCRACRAPLFWATTPRGKNIPLDPQPTLDGNVEIVEGEAVVLAGVHLDAARRAGAQLYTSHFATCPHASEFRRAS